MPPRGGNPRPPAPAPVANVHTGNNPRGVAIVVPKAPPKMLQTGANPRGVAIIPRFTAAAPTPKAKPKSSGGGSHPIGTITGPLLRIASPAINEVGAALAHISPVEKIIGNLAKDVINLPSSTLLSGYAVGKSALDDFLHRATDPRAGLDVSTRKHDFLNVAGAPNLSRVATQVANTDPALLALQGRWKEAGHSATEHPLNAVLDATGLYGMAGKATGAVARAAGADSASLARGDRVAAPGIPGTAVVQHYSPNYFTARAQRAFEGSAGRMRRQARGLKVGQAFEKHTQFQLPVSQPLNDLRRQTAMTVGPVRASTQKLHDQFVKAMNKAKPKGKLEAAVAPYVAAFGGGRELLPLMHSHLVQAIDAGEAGIHAPAHLKILEAAMAKDAARKLNWTDINRAANVFKEHQSALEPWKDALGIHTLDEMRRGLAKRSMLMHDPLTKYIEGEGLMRFAHSGDSGAKLVKLSGDRVAMRPVTDAEREAHLAQYPNASYVRMTNPDRPSPMSLAEMKSDRGYVGGNSKQPYSGFAAMTGDFRPGWNRLLQSGVSDIRQIGEQSLQNQIIDRFGLTKPEGAHFSLSEAMKARNQYEMAHGIKMEPVKIRPGSDQYTLLPKVVADEMRGHYALNRPSLGGKAMLKTTKGLRNTALAMSTKLPIMHSVEGAVRGGLVGATPMSRMLYHDVTKRMEQLDPERAAAFKDVNMASSYTGHQQKLSDESMASLLGEGKTQAALHTLGAPLRVWDTTAKQLIASHYWIENEFRRGVIGVHMRKQMQEFGYTWAHANLAVRDLEAQLARHYLDPKHAEDAARYVNKAMGQYNNFTARQRFLFSRIAPFMPWYLNAARLVYKTLPKDHPLLSALNQGIANANEKQWHAIHTGLYPDMKNYIPEGNNHWLDIGRFTPVGLPTDPAAIENLLFPAVSGPVHALVGEDPFGKPFVGPKTPYRKAEYQQGDWGTFPLAAESLAQTVGGPLGTVSRILEEHGGTLYNTSLPIATMLHVPGAKSWVKKGSVHGSGLNKALNPFYGTYLKPKGKGGGRGYGGGATGYGGSSQTGYGGGATGYGGSG